MTNKELIKKYETAKASYNKAMNELNEYTAPFVDLCPFDNFDEELWSAIALLSDNKESQLKVAEKLDALETAKEAIMTAAVKLVSKKSGKYFASKVVQGFNAPTLDVQEEVLQLTIDMLKSA